MRLAAATTIEAAEEDGIVACVMIVLSRNIKSVLLNET
jgi:hypothetical protein